MTFATFSDDLKLGHPEIDRQHEALFGAINRLHEALRSNSSRQVQGEILAFLHAYTREHFAAEEALMKEAGYPEREAHHLLHEGLVKQIEELEGKYALGTMTLSIMTLHFLKDWLTHHILEEDLKLATHLRA